MLHPHFQVHIWRLSHDGMASIYAVEAFQYQGIILIIWYVLAAENNQCHWIKYNFSNHWILNSKGVTLIFLKTQSYPFREIVRVSGGTTNRCSFHWTYLWGKMSILIFATRIELNFPCISLQTGPMNYNTSFISWNYKNWEELTVIRFPSSSNAVETGGLICSSVTFGNTFEVL
jgi:hypothetical protein